LLVLAAIALTIPSLLFRTLGPKSEVQLSEEVAGVLLVTYLLSLVFSLATQAEEPVTSSIPHAPEAQAWGMGRAIATLFLAVCLVAVLSEFLAGALETAQESGSLASLGMSEVFVGVVVVAVVGNAAENSTAVIMAYRNKVDLALHIAMGSSLQI